MYWWRFKKESKMIFSHALRWRHNDHAGISNHQPHGCLLNRLFRRKSKKTSKLRVTGLCAGNSPGTGEFPAQMASYAENVSIWWRHHDAMPQCLGPMKQSKTLCINISQRLTHKQLDTHRCILGTVSTDALVPVHQGNSIYCAKRICIVLDLICTEMSKF